MTPASLRHTAPLIGAVLLGAACAINPVSNRPEVVLVSEEREREIGAQVAREVEAAMGLVDDAALAAYVQGLGARLAAESPRTDVAWRFGVVDRDEPNAFAAPGGFVYVSRGLIALTNSEDELANVLAHEIVHVAARHHVQSATRATSVGLLSLPAALVGVAVSGVLGDTVTAPVEALSKGVLAGYGRSQEREADRVGQELARAAGYDPGALAAFLVTLEQAELLRTGRKRMPSFLDTHPSTPERVQGARAHAASLERVPARDTAAYFERLDGLLLGPNPAEGVFDGARFLHPELGFTLRFPDDWRTLNSRQAVVGVSPRGDARILLQAGPAGEPAAAGQAFLTELAEAVSIEVEGTEELRIGGLPAWRAQVVATTSEGRVSLDLTWVAHGGRLYRITGAAPAVRALPTTFRDAALSFRPLRPAERAALRELRLRFAVAQPGESLAQLVARTGSRWDASRAALYNGLDPEQVFDGGERIKVAREQPYTSRLAAR